VLKVQFHAQVNARLRFSIDSVPQAAANTTRREISDQWNLIVGHFRIQIYRLTIEPNLPRHLDMLENQVADH
jgi:hypothetical protein